VKGGFATDLGETSSGGPCVSWETRLPVKRSRFMPMAWIDRIFLGRRVLSNIKEYRPGRRVKPFTTIFPVKAGARLFRSENDDELISQPTPLPDGRDNFFLRCEAFFPDFCVSLFASVPTRSPFSKTGILPFLMSLPLLEREGAAFHLVASSRPLLALIIPGALRSADRASRARNLRFSPHPKPPARHALILFCGQRKHTVKPWWR